MRKLFIVLVAVLVSFLNALPVAAIAQPDSPSQIRTVYAYEDLLEDGDQGYLIDYYSDYAVLPTESITEAYLVVLIDTDGTTQLRSVAPYAFNDDGYGRGIAWIYFSAADAPVWNQAYFIWIVGNPTLTWAGGTPPKTIGGIDVWQTAGTDTAQLVASRVLYYAAVLEAAWAQDMIEATSVGDRLTTTGESYFMNAMPNIRTFAPLAFSAGTVEPVLDPDVQDFSDSWVDQIVVDITGTPLDFTDLGTALGGMSRESISLFLWLVGMAALLLPTVRFLGIKAAIIIMDFLIVAGGLIGMVSWQFLIGLGVLAVIATGYILFYRGSSA